ncbi:MAG: septum formation inhibitor Maf [Desulfobulbaceae bacterium]|nr:septum formation inhibitor Maf [Desulfobulbaceae bacterium]
MKAAIFKTAQKLILASGSPRRKAFFEDLGLTFTVMTAKIDETPRATETPENFVIRLAREKAEAVARHCPDSWVVGADTTVVLGEKILGKPDDRKEALQMLLDLSGKWHEVWTGYCIYKKDRDELLQKAVVTEVCFDDLTKDLCRSYVMTSEPLDKAGAYGIQGQGGALVKAIRGSYSNVVGLPLAEMTRDMLSLGIIRTAH